MEKVHTLSRSQSNQTINITVILIQHTVEHLWSNQLKCEGANSQTKQGQPILIWTPIYECLELSHVTGSSVHTYMYMNCKLLTTKSKARYFCIAFPSTIPDTSVWITFLFPSHWVVVATREGLHGEESTIRTKEGRKGRSSCWLQVASCLMSPESRAVNTFGLGLVGIIATQWQHGIILDIYNTLTKLLQKVLQGSHARQSQFPIFWSNNHMVGSFQYINSYIQQSS